MNIILITICILINVFLCRALNKYLYLKDNWTIEVQLWFVPVAPLMVLIIGFIEYKLKGKIPPIKIGSLPDSFKRIGKWFILYNVRKHE